MITKSEIPQAAEKLKNNISPFSDKIRSEMIKASFDTLMPVYEKLLNSILNLGTMPQTWCGVLLPFIACVAGVRNWGRGRQLGRKTTREGGGRRGTPAGKPLFLPPRLLIKRTSTITQLSITSCQISLAGMHVF